MNDHPHRDRIARELHARPFISLQAPVRLLHLSMLDDKDGGEAARTRLAELLREHGLELPDGVPTGHFIGQIGTTHIKWERHAEFTSWTVWRDAPGETPFAAGRGEGLTDDLSADWLRTLPGALLVALRVHVLGPTDTAPDREMLQSCFDVLSVCGSRLGGANHTEVWTDFRPGNDGCVRMLVHDQLGDARQLGRRVQRLMEVETYRSMALLGLPVAQEVTPLIDDAEARLATITATVEKVDDFTAEQALLEGLMQLSAKSEELAAATAYRFSASDAYFAIVSERLRRLAESPLGELPTIGSFMDRRFSPAMRTCQHTRVRLDTLATRITRAANLLRTRVDLAMEAHNRDLLASMERRARLQLRLQQTVEGLSVAAITYYVVGLVGYVAKAAHAGGLTVSSDIITGAAVPLVALLIWRGVRRFRNRIERDER